MAQLIAPGTDEQNAEFTLVDGTSTLLNLKPASNALVEIPARAAAIVQIKTSDGGYVVDPRYLLTAEAPTALLAGPGTWRVIRRACAISFGVDRT